MSLLDVKLPKRYEGEFSARIKRYTEHVNEQGGYVELLIDLGEDREIKFNMFPSQFHYWNEGLQKQFLGETNEETTLLEMVVQATRDEFKAWVSWNTEYNRYNIDLYEQSYKTEDAVNLRK